MEAIKEVVVSRGLFRTVGLVYGLAGERGQTGRLVTAQPEWHGKGEYQRLAFCTVHTSEQCTETLYRCWGTSAGVGLVAKDK